MPGKNEAGEWERRCPWGEFTAAAAVGEGLSREGTLEWRLE